MISPLAVVSSKATIGNNVSIGPFTVVHDDVVIGDNTKIKIVLLYSMAHALGRVVIFFREQ